MPLARRRRARAGTRKLPQTLGLQRVKRQLRSFLTFPLRYGRLCAVMQEVLSDQGRERGRRLHASLNCRLGGSEPPNWRMGKCSPMFAYVRFIGEKCLRRRMANAVQSCKMHDTRRWGLVELAPPSTRSNVWHGRTSTWSRALDAGKC
jgi:hypothetical protein